MFINFKRMIPYFLALVGVLMSLRGLSPGRFNYPIDAPRRALNGAFIYDLVRSGNITHPFQYGKQFYSRFPALSIPYHPPLFPVIESLSYAIFGVNQFAARLPVAVATGVCLLLLYRLAYRSHRSAWLASAAAMTFIALPISQWLATDVMLEFPSLAFALGSALLPSRPGDRIPAVEGHPIRIAGRGRRVDQTTRGLPGAGPVPSNPLERELAVVAD